LFTVEKLQDLALTRCYYNPAPENNLSLLNVKKRGNINGKSTVLAKTLPETSILLDAYKPHVQGQFSVLYMNSYLTARIVINTCTVQSSHRRHSTLIGLFNILFRNNMFNTVPGFWSFKPLVSIDCNLGAKRFGENQHITNFSTIRPDRKCNSCHNNAWHISKKRY
jgi:hypothetical protein